MLLVEPCLGADRRLAIEDLYGLYRRIDEVVANHGGTVVRLHGDGALSVFDDSAAAVRAASVLGTSQSSVRLRAAVHRASAGAVTLNERLDYFGACVQEVIELVARAKPGELVISDAIAGDADVQDALRCSEPVEATLDDVGLRRRLGPTVLSSIASEAPAGP
jgi:adenylate cyclase